MNRRLFCEISPLTYQISVIKCRTVRKLKDLLIKSKLARKKQQEPLPFLVCSHKSLIRRKFGNVNPVLQDNKAVNLAIAAPKVSSVIIAPGEIFSFWSLVGKCSKKKGYKEGLTIRFGEPSKDVGGGMCQFTNLLHWLVLHTPLTVVEHHHHDGIDMFPDYGRQVPFGVGTSIMYNYLDYRFANNTGLAYQLVVWVTDEHLCGEIRSSGKATVKYHIKNENEYFSSEDGVVYRNGEIYRECIDIKSGNLISRELIKRNHARVLYAIDGLDIAVTI